MESEASSSICLDSDQSLRKSLISPVSSEKAPSLNIFTLCVCVCVCVSTLAEELITQPQFSFPSAVSSSLRDKLRVRDRDSKTNRCGQEKTHLGLEELNDNLKKYTNVKSSLQNSGND